MFTLLITALHDRIGIITIDESGNIRSVNPFMSKLFGHTEKHLLQMNISSLMPRPYRCALRSEVDS